MQPPDPGKRKTPDRKVFVVSGPSGAGKGTLIRGAIKYFPDISVAVSATTRKPRAGEVDGREYHFFTDEEFDEAIARGEFLEYVEFTGNRYGTLKGEIERLHDQGHHAILELELEGALHVKKMNPDSVLIFIQPPDIDELERRLVVRAAETEEEIKERVEIARYQLQARKQFDHVITNDDQSTAIAELQHVFAQSLGRDNSRANRV